MDPIVQPLRSPKGHPALDRTTVELALSLAPDRCPKPEDSEREIWMKAGERRLAVRLNAILIKQEDG